ncbi:MAG: hypothetical protein P4L70_03775 [Parasulfuritortus sp.]|jgi:uncharacterized low-complexity protein|nr:hypothetical protein [Parasulfuritortus sp.]
MKAQTTLALAVTAAVAGTGLAWATDSPFAMQALSQGYLVAEADPATNAKAAEAKCGSAHAKAVGGKCGAATNRDATPAAKTKAKTRKKTTPKAVEAKCGEAKCGGMK